MRAGLLNTPVTFLARKPVKDVYSSGAATWVPALETRCRVEEEKGALTTEAGEPVYRRRLTLTVRVYHQIDPSWRVVVLGQTWTQLMPSVPDPVLQCRKLYLELLND